MPKKGKEEELPLSDEAKDVLMHTVLVQLKRLTEGIDPIDVADDLLATPQPEASDEDTTVLTVRLGRETYCFRVPASVAYIVDILSARSGSSRNAFLRDSIWSYCLPSWLTLLATNDGDLKGSLSIVFRNLENRARETASHKNAERAIFPLMKDIQDYMAAGDDEGWYKSAIEFTYLIENIDGIRDNYWRRRLIGQVLADHRRVKTVLTVLEDQEVDGHKDINKTIKRWDKEAIR